MSKFSFNLISSLFKFLKKRIKLKEEEKKLEMLPSRRRKLQFSQQKKKKTPDKLTSHINQQKVRKKYSSQTNKVKRVKTINYIPKCIDWMEIGFQ